MEMREWRLGVLKFEMSLKMEEGGGLKGEGEGEGEGNSSSTSMDGCVLFNFDLNFEGFLGL